MTSDRPRSRATRLALLFVTVPLWAGCGSSPVDPVTNEAAVPTATITPAAGTITGASGTTTTTVVFTGSPGLAPPSFGLTKPGPDFYILEDSRETSGTSTTIVYTIGLFNSVAPATYSFSFSAVYPVTNGSLTSTVEFELTVN